MKVLSSLLLLIPALASAAERELQTLPDWHVTMLSVAAQSFTFETGAGGGGSVNIKIEVLDKCRMESATRTHLGDFYPSPNVAGINVVTTGVAGPGPDINPNVNQLSFTFGEGIAQNTDIYTETPNPDGVSEAVNAEVNFCVLTGLYDGTMLVDFAEVKLTYNIDLVTQIPELTGYTVTQAEQFQDEGTQQIEFDGQLEAFFCNPTTHAKLENDNNNAKTNQGSILNVCFKVIGGQFEVDDIMSFTVSELDTVTGLPKVGGPTQDIIVNSDSASALYSTKNCVDDTTSDKNICVVSFLLKADFYDYSAMILTGEGDVLLEFGTSESGARRRLRRKLQVDPVEEHVQVEPQAFEVENPNQLAGSSASAAMTSLAAVGAIAGAALAL